MTVGELTSFIYLFTLLVFPLRLIGFTLSEVPHSLAGWNRIRELLDQPVVADPALTLLPRPRQQRGAARRALQSRRRARRAARRLRHTSRVAERSLWWVPPGPARPRCCTCSPV